MVRRQIAIATFFFCLGSPLRAEPPVRITIPGTAFSQQGVGARVAVANVGSGRRFRGAGQDVILEATIKLPPASSAEPRLERLAVHFRSENRSGASVQSVELRNGGAASIHLSTDLRGDYTARETLTPAVVANTWVFKSPTNVTAQSVIRLEVRFAGGFEGSGTSDMLITSVTLDFPSKVKPVPSTPVPSKPVPSTPVPSKPVPSTPVPTKPQAPTTQLSSPGDVIYALTADNELLWYSHSGRKDGSFRWATDPKKVGTGWNVKHVFSGGDGVIYAITDNGDLLWNRHDGRNDGSFKWAADNGKKVGSDWNYKHVFSGGDGVIYAITDNGDLIWNRHEGRNDGSDKWAATEPKKVGTGWNVKQVFAGGDGVIYAITDNGDLIWNRHEGRNDGSFEWAAPNGKKVGSDWNFKQVFSGVGGVIYTITDANVLLWHRHDGRGDGSSKWTALEGNKVGSGWSFKEVFCGEILGE
jgi:hypothetical protein